MDCGHGETLDKAKQLLNKPLHLKYQYNLQLIFKTDHTCLKKAGGFNNVVRLHCVAEEDYLADEVARASLEERYATQKDNIDQAFVTVSIWIPDILDPRLPTPGSLFQVFPATGTSMFGLQHQMTTYINNIHLC